MEMVVAVFPYRLQAAAQLLRGKKIAVVAMLHKTAEPIYHELLKLNQDAVAETGVPLHGLDVMAALERIREREGDRIGYLVRRRD